MKFCTKCGTQLDDNAAVCSNCGNGIGNNANFNNQEQQSYYQQPVQQYIDPYDHTNEFDPKDISDNKAVAMLPYLLGAMGILIAVLMSKTSDYVNFHVRQALKLVVVETLLVIIAAVLFFTLLIPFAAGVCMIIIFVLKIIQFFSICSGKAKEVPIIRGLGFLK